MKSVKKAALFFCSTIVLIALFVPGTVFAETYEYDSAGRLTAVTYDNNDNITYAYDSAGNITEQSSTFFIPSLSEWGMLLFVILLLFSGMYIIKYYRKGQRP